MRDIERVYATTAGKEGRVYFLLDKEVAGRRKIGNPETRNLEIGKRYLVSISVSSKKGVRRIISFNEIPAEAGITKRKRQNGSVFIPMPGIERMFPAPKVDETFFIAEDVESIISAIMKAYKGRNANVFLLGPQGVGKTSLATQIAALHGYNYFEFQVPQVREPMDWIGRLVPEAGSIRFDENMLVSAVSVPRTVVCLNEFNRVETNLHNVTYELLSDKRRAFFEELHQEVRVAPDVIFIITMNISHDNVGTFPLDSALWDRANVILEVTWMPIAKEIATLIMRTGIHEDQARRIVDVATLLRGMWEDGKIPVAPSFRWLESSARMQMSAPNLPWKEILNRTIVAHYAHYGNDTGSFKAIVTSAIQAKFGDLVK